VGAQVSVVCDQVGDIHPSILAQPGTSNGVRFTGASVELLVTITLKPTRLQETPFQLQDMLVKM
jgi:hypothetical protein